MFVRVLLAVVLLAIARPSFAGASVIADSPGKVLSVSVWTDSDGRALDPGRRYRAEIYRDGADWKLRPQDIDVEGREVTSAGTLTLRLAAGGGEAIRFVAIARKARP